MSKKKQESESESETSIADDMPSSNVRSVLSFLLFVHLFCVGMALVCVFAPSELQIRLARIAAPYTRFFALDLNSQFYFAPYHLTQGQPLDDDFLIEIEWSDAQGDLQVLPLTQDCLRGSCAHQRRQLLARFISGMAAEDNDNATSPLAEMLVGRTLRDHDASIGTIRVRQRMSVNIAPPKERPDPFDPDLLRTTYEARVEITDDGSVLVFKLSEEGQVAPVD